MQCLDSRQRYVFRGEKCELTDEDGDVFPLLQYFVEHLVGDLLDLVGLLLVQKPTENLIQIKRILTRFGPNRVERNGEFDFLEISQNFWRNS